MRLAGKVAVVTGGGSGIGRAIAEEFTRAGAQVVVVDRTGESGVIGDVGRAETWDEVRETVLERWGRWDVLVNNAGYGIRATAEKTSLDEWQAILQTNVTSVFLGSRAAVPVMRENGGGSVVNMASVAGTIGMAERAAYCATKAAVVGLTKAMSVDHAADGIRFNCVAPGTIDTPYFTKIAAEVDDVEAFRAGLAARQPLGRLGQPAEVAAAALFLASAESSFATGSVVTVDGGMSVW
ncbi:SDR family oxidoreductase [Amycolatopsis jejuensis]|uniref:SDR family oxidoreductase n=1 Tax=Amycolatopsis jejuensis TaxID=330084 RepID=UPI000524E9CF|nr:SDR family oxidoreductase [Amycolatopsis jejuensis]